MTLPTPAVGRENTAPAIRAVEAFVLRSPIETPIRTSFGVMYDRPAVFVRVMDVAGATGWGEIWCNFPTCGAEHRARLIRTLFAPLIEGQRVDDPRIVFAAGGRKRLSSETCGQPAVLSASAAFARQVRYWTKAIIPAAMW